MSEELNKEILQLYNYLKKSSTHDNLKDEYSTDIDMYAKQDIHTDNKPMQEIYKQGIITIRNRHIKIKHKYKVRHKML